MWNGMIRFQSYASNLYVFFLDNVFFLGMNNIWAVKVMLLKSSHFQGEEKKPMTSKG